MTNPRAVEATPGASGVFDHPSGFRRSAARIEVLCEAGHPWSLLIQQHKGELLVFARTMEDDPR